ncbi:hypothetical protein O181_007961 [Austropuccinia psidii MF-1]|uniref:Homologous-pairing protein 2 winged helix domain-containing protein n=1 Tax=Austropuccinia psidii MF-1 TaxID=1389203 RepID=A0A9Q3BNX9_9BASI|nr:hypothetical protein [Austropuccinia psidii MF-1]
MENKPAGKAKLDKSEFIKGAEAEAMILSYLIDQNRPHNPTDISANLKVIKKVDTMKCLTYLHEAQKIDMKLFGKQAVYCCKQSDLETAPPELLSEKQRELEDLKEKIKKAKEENSRLKLELDELGKQPSSIEIPVVKSSLKQEWIELQSRLLEMSEKISNEEVKETSFEMEKELFKLEARTEKYKTLCRKYERSCKEAIKTIMDQLDSDNSINFDEMCEKIGLEAEPAELAIFELQKSQTDGANNIKKSTQPYRPTGVKRTLSGCEKL